MSSSGACTLKLRSAAGLGLHSLRGKACKRCTVLVRAEDGRKVDWDKEWDSFQQRKSTTGGSNSRVRTSSRIPVDPAAKTTRDAIKREESFLLNAWSSNVFQGAGVAVAVLVLLVILLSAGPPPADSRCTLPWC